MRKLWHVKSYEATFEIRARQSEAARLDEAHQGAVIQLADAVLRPDRRLSLKCGFIVMVATMAGFVIRIFAAFQAGFRHSKKDVNPCPKWEASSRALLVGAKGAS